MPPTHLALPVLAALPLALGCASTGHPPLATVPSLDLERYMGDWYVLAHIPASLERNAHGAVESYRLEPDGTIATTFTFREGSHDGEPKRYTPRARVVDRVTRAHWDMKFFWFWPAQEFLVVHVDDGYTETIVGRTKRDYVWIMARTPELPAADYDRLVRRVGEMGYDLAKLRKVPQRPPAPAGGPSVSAP